MFSNGLNMLGQFVAKANHTLMTAAKLNRVTCMRCVHQQFKQQPQQQRHQQLYQNLQQKVRSVGTRTTSALPNSNYSINGNPKTERFCLVLWPFCAVSCAAIGSGTECVPQSSVREFSSSSKSSQADDNDNAMSNDNYKNANSIYEFTVKDTHGNDVSLEKYKGNVVLIVNIASQCGLTKNNYKQLTELKEKYHDKGLRILNFPCNQFNSQMPEADGEAMVCHLRDAKADIGDLFQKVDVNGANAAPLYQYLKAKQSGTLGSAIKWNFTKFLVDKEGKPVNRYAPTTEPHSIVKDIEKLL